MNIYYNETEILSRERGKTVAENFYKTGQRDPLQYVKPALLSADEIVEYVKMTGAISPFYYRGKHSRLKKASYEGRIGEKAYRYDENGKLIEMILNDELILQANSIVFVESDLDFRLPDFIALRFNLQIRHVHRGLLLGTGPLVDPGFWGKLCIPLHNLTNEDYFIPKEEGLIWVELTKTSGAVQSGRNALDSKGNKSKKGYWNIRKDFIEKAARPFDETKPTYSIQSSIYSVAETAKKEANEAKKSREETTKQVESMRMTGTIAVAIFMISVFMLISEFYANTKAIYTSLVPQIREEINTVSDKAKSNDSKTERLKEEIDRLRIENTKIQERLLLIESLSDEE